MLFANDTLIFYDATKEHIKYLSWVFTWFKAISGLGCGRRKISKTTCYVKETIPIKRRKTNFIKNILSSLPVYFMSLFFIPRKVSLKLEKI